MNTARASLKKTPNILFSAFLNSSYYTIPIGMFLVACNCLFESVRNYYFNWMIVVLPTVVICVLGSLYEMFVSYQKNGFFEKRENTFTTKKVGYSMLNKESIAS